MRFQQTPNCPNSLFMCQDEDENEDENQSFGSFWNLCMTNEPILRCIIVLRAWFVRHRLYPERTKTFVFGFVFVLAHKKPIDAKGLIQIGKLQIIIMIMNTLMVTPGGIVPSFSKLELHARNPDSV